MLATSQAQEAGVHVRHFKWDAYWRELCRYRFMISPLGDEIQSPKTVEALLVLTVPIVHRGPSPIAQDLRRMGFPLVIVNEWDEITRFKTDVWWYELSPRLASFRDNCLTADSYWQLIVGNIIDCY